jgi:integrase
LEEWLEYRRKDIKKNNLSEGTFGGYQSNVQKIIAPYFRDSGILLSELTEDDINEFYDDMFEAGKANETVINYHTNIGNALRYAVKMKRIPSYETIMLNVQRPADGMFRGKFLKPSEAVKLCDAVKDDKLELGVILGTYYGLRRSEVVGLRWESINFETGYITIEHTVIRARVDGELKIIAKNRTKTKSSLRSLPMIPALRMLLMKIKATQEHNKKLCGRSYNRAESAYIYTDAQGNRIKPDYPPRHFRSFY